MAVLEKDKSVETSNDMHGKIIEKKKNRKRKAAEMNVGDGDLSFSKQENADVDSQLEVHKKKKKKLQGDGNGVEKQDRKKMKRNRDSDNNHSSASSVQVANNVLLGKESGSEEVHNIEGVEVNKKKKEKLQEDENGVEKLDRNMKKKKKNRGSGDNCNHHPTVKEDEGVKVNKKKKKKLQEGENGVATKENGDNTNHHPTVQEDEGVRVNTKKKKKMQEGENGVETKDRKKKKNKKANKDKRNSPSSVQDIDAANEGGDEATKKKKKSKTSENIKTTPNKSNKKVRFSGQDEVFTVPSKSDGSEETEDLVRGKRFTQEEDSIVEKAVHDYIEEHNLGEEGLDMVLNSRKHVKEVKGCWREIGKAIPYRPYVAVYHRAQILFRRSENRSWTQEEYDMVLKHQQLNGNEWKSLADELGKHHWHVKDAYRRIKLLNRNKGHWSQKEYQNLFDLVNADLQLKLTEEKKSKHGMLRDNICWSGISDRMETRAISTCCVKWYSQLTSPMVVDGIWADADDYRLVAALYSLDENCMEDVDWDNLVEGRSGEVCRKRWRQMRKHIGHHGKETFSGQVEVLAQRYCPHLVEAREAWDSKPFVDLKPAVEQ